MALPSIPEYDTSIKVQDLVLPAVLQDGHPIEKRKRLVKYAGGFCVVYPYQTPSKKYAVRCWHAEIAESKQRTKLISEALHASGLPYFVGFDYYDEGIVTAIGKQPIVVMDWVDALPLKKYIGEHIHESSVISVLADTFMTMVKDLHRNHFSHGDLQHGNIMVKNDGSIILVDYDSMYVPSLQGMKDEIKGLVGYQHNARWNNEFLSEKADYFSELVIYLSLKALALFPSLWDDLHIEDTETMLFSKEDIDNPSKSMVIEKLKSNSTLAPMVNRLIEFVGKTSIDELLPLEKVLISEVEEISSKWTFGNGYKQKKAKVTESSMIYSKWGNGNGYIKSEVNQKKMAKLSDNISNKFKRSE